MSYTKTVPCTLYEVFSQYYDYEHIEHVHPESLGRYELVETLRDGEVVVYDQFWPKGGRSRVRHTYDPPLSMTFEFLEGRHRGVRVETRLSPESEVSTRIEETYSIPRLPNWRWLGRAIRPWVMKPVNHIWQEDLDVDVCIDGWPGIPSSARTHLTEVRRRPEYPPLPDSPTSANLPDRQPVACLVDDQPAVLLRSGKTVRRISPQCPHTGAPLALARVEEGDPPRLVCPWHGARFDLETGRRLSGPRCADLKVQDWNGMSADQP